MVVSDTTPINYLVQIHHLDLLHRLFGTVSIPPAVRTELLHPAAPAEVRDFAWSLPSWITLRGPSPIHDPVLLKLHKGEQQAIALAEELHADFLLTDDYMARKAAGNRGLPVLTTLLVLDTAAERGWISFEEAMQRLLSTNFRVDPFTMKQILQKHE